MIVNPSPNLNPNLVTDFSQVCPFVKWAGGKRQLLPELNKMIPGQFNTYFEPFLGGGALYFHLISKGMRFNAYISDVNVGYIQR